ncbi:MAG: ribosome-binding factor A [Holosporales bacterium]|nr:ribosome-binding factor A [Holosporales bacterium]
MCDTIAVVCNSPRRLWFSGMSRVDLFDIQKKRSGSKRNDRIAAQIRECFSMALIRGDFPLLPNHAADSKIPCSITITYVNVSPDLRNAVVFFSPAIADKVTESLRFFTAQAHFFKTIISKKMHIKYIPELQFKLDDSVQYSQRIDELLKHDSSRE